MARSIRHQRLSAGATLVRNSSPQNPTADFEGAPAPRDRAGRREPPPVFRFSYGSQAVLTPLCGKIAHSELGFERVGGTAFSQVHQFLENGYLRRYGYMTAARQLDDRLGCARGILG